ncbi:hypothetical protein RB653_004645 [Dictyostelium firmibasis]|uniref:Uncharacterized protein n=1 Tax=Dictyostelium firmibasis TaxID=79012 RepID=A0AAN7Z3H7_9MYCE
MNKKIKVDNLNIHIIREIEVVFWKVWKNKLLRNYIVSFLSKSFKDYEIPFSTFKYNEVYSSEWMILNNHHGLLLDKVNRKEYLTFNSGVIEEGNINIKSKKSNIVTQFKKTIFNFIENASIQDQETFYYTLFKNYSDIFLNSFQNTATILIKYDCLSGLKVLKHPLLLQLQQKQKQKQQKQEDNSQKIIIDKNLFFISINFSSFKTANYLFTNYKHLFKFSEKELINSIIRDDESESIIKKFKFIQNEILPNLKSPSNKYQINSITFKFSFYKTIKLIDLIDCCFCLDNFKVNIQNYLKSLLLDLKTNSKAFNIFLNSLKIDNLNDLLLSLTELNLMKQSLIKEFGESLDKFTYQYPKSNSIIESLLKMVLPFISLKTLDYYNDGKISISWFEDSLQYLICNYKSISNPNQLNKFFPSLDPENLMSLQFKYGIYNSNCFSRLSLIDLLFQYQIDQEKRKQFIISFFKTIEIFKDPTEQPFAYQIKVIKLVSRLSFLNDLESIKFVYNLLENNQSFMNRFQILPELKYWNCDILDYFKKQPDFKINFKFLIINAAPKSILNHYYNNYYVGSNGVEIGADIKRKDKIDNNDQNSHILEQLQTIIQERIDGRLSENSIIMLMGKNLSKQWLDMINWIYLNKNEDFTVEILGSTLFKLFNYQKGIFPQITTQFTNPPLKLLELIGERSCKRNLSFLSNLIEHLYESNSTFLQHSNFNNDGNEPITVILRRATEMGNIELFKHCYENHRFVFQSFDTDKISDISIVKYYTSMIEKALENGHSLLYNFLYSILKLNVLCQENDNNYLLCHNK